LKISKKFEKYTLVTTAKDFVRFDDHNDPNKELRKVLDVLDMNIKFDNEDILLELI
jgi:tetraacyldisaccharide-1-P 4'-kinase